MVNTSVRKSRESVRKHTVRLVRIAIFVALIIVGAFIKVPIGIVPVAMQFAFCMLAGLILGAKDALIAVVIYLVMGLAGIPIFTAGGGIFYVFQPTFGYMLGYLVAIPLCGIIARGWHNDAPIKFGRMLLGAFCAMAIVYVFGVIYMYCMLNFYVGSEIAMSKAWLSGCAVFLPTDSMFCVLGSLIATKVLPLINKHIK